MNWASVGFTVNIAMAVVRVGVIADVDNSGLLLLLLLLFAHFSLLLCLLLRV